MIILCHETMDGDRGNKPVAHVLALKTARRKRAMQQRSERSKVSTASQLQNHIQRGHTGDKVSAFDPAAVPLGTGEEAAGPTVPAEAMSEAIAMETARPNHRAEARRDRRVVVTALIAVGIGGLLFMAALIIMR